MKYSEFLQLDELLLEHNITLEDLKENPHVLNEVGIGALIGGFVALFGLGIIFGKNLIRLGINKVYLSKLKKWSDDFKNNILEKTSEIAKNSAQLRQTINKKRNELKDKEGPNIENEIRTLKQQKKQIDRTTSKNISDFIDKQASSKTKEIHQKIDEVSRLKDSQKLALKSFWDGFIPNIKIEAFKKMIEDGIITDMETINTLKREFTNKQKELKKKLIDVQNNLKDDIKYKKEEEKKEQKPEQKSEKKETKTTEKKTTSKPEQTILKQEDNL